MALVISHCSCNSISVFPTYSRDYTISISKIYFFSEKEYQWRTTIKRCTLDQAIFYEKETVNSPLKNLQRQSRSMHGKNFFSSFVHSGLTKTSSSGMKCRPNPDSSIFSGSTFKFSKCNPLSEKKVPDDVHGVAFWTMAVPFFPYRLCHRRALEWYRRIHTPN